MAQMGFMDLCHLTCFIFFILKGVCDYFRKHVKYAFETVNGIFYQKIKGKTERLGLI